MLDFARGSHASHLIIVIEIHILIPCNPESNSLSLNGACRQDIGGFVKPLSNLKIAYSEPTNLKVKK